MQIGWPSPSRLGKKRSLRHAALVWLSLLLMRLPTASPRSTWLYVLGSDCTLEQSYVYVGMTYRLKTRLHEHHSRIGKGAQSTQKWNYNHLLAVYEIDKHEGHDHEKENELTAQIMRLKGSAWWQVRGGSSTGIEQDRPMPELLQKMRDDNVALPRTCFCTLPCAREVSKTTGRPYFKCAGRTEWLQGKIPQETDNGCSFFDFDWGCV